jgi:hypothetical protein
MIFGLLTAQQNIHKILLVVFLFFILCFFVCRQAIFFIQFLMVITTKILSNFASIPNIVQKIMDGFKKTPIPADFLFKRIRLECLERSIFKLISVIHENLKKELHKINNSSNKNVRIGSITVFDFRLQILNLSRTCDNNTRLQVKIPMKLLFDLFVESLCEYFEVNNDR